MKAQRYAQISEGKQCAATLILKLYHHEVSPFALTAAITIIVEYITNTSMNALKVQ